MAKYYVSSGDHEQVISATTPENAAIELINRLNNDNSDNVEVGLAIRVSEIGFGSTKQPGHENDVFFYSMHIMDEVLDKKA